MDKKVKVNIYKKRNELELTQNEVAQKIGISLTAYRDIENGKTKIFNTKLSKLAEIFGTSVEELVLGYEPVPENADKLNELKGRYEKEIQQMQEKYEKEINNLEEKLEDKDQLLKKSEEVSLSKDETIRTKDQIILYLQEKH